MRDDYTPEETEYWNGRADERKEWEDKIKAKIEENGEKYREIESNYTEQMLDDGDVDLDDYVGMQSIQFADDILQSLLEKE